MSTLTPTFYARKTSTGNPIEFERLPVLEAYLKQFQTGTRLVVTVKKYVPKRSGRQNSYYHGVVVKMIADETGMTPEETHEGLKIKFLSVQHDERLPTVRSTARLTTKEFMEYIDKITVWAAQFLGLVLPDPYSVDY